MMEHLSRSLHLLIVDLSVYSHQVSHYSRLKSDTLKSWGALIAEGISAPPLLVFEMLCLLDSEPMSFCVNAQRERVSELKSLYTETRHQLVVGQLSSNKKYRALKALFYHAPKYTGAEGILNLERSALSGAYVPYEGSDETEEISPKDRWSLWRRDLERSMISQLCYRWHLMLSGFRAERPLCLPLLDEGALGITALTRDQLAELQVKAKAGTGSDDQRFRFPQGSFFEVGHDALPSDPARILISDLALFAERRRASRATLLVKISDSNLSVRFAEIQRPSRRRARIRCVISLMDAFSHHVYQGDDQEPLVDILRRTICHIIPALYEIISEAGLDGELRVIREGVGGHGQKGLGWINSDERKSQKYVNARSTTVSLMAEEKWFFEDYLVHLSNKNRSPERVPPISSDDDLLIVIWHGSRPSWVSEFEPFQEIGVELKSDEVMLHRKNSDGPNLSQDVYDQVHDAQKFSVHSIARLVINQLDLSVQRNRAGLSKNQWGGTSI